MMSRIRLVYFILLSFVSMAGISAGAADLPHNSLSVRFDLDTGTLRGTSKISLPAGGYAEVGIFGLNVLSAREGDKTIIVEPGISSIPFRNESGTDELVIEYEAEFPSSVPDENDEPAGAESVNSISRKGITLFSEWHPVVRGLSIYSLSATVPNGYTAVSAAEEVSVREKTDVSMEFQFTFPHPRNGVSLVAAQYSVQTESYRGVAISTYFFPDDGELAARYMEYARKYIGMYEDLVAAFPFTRFSVVQNVLPGGASFPSFMVIGSRKAAGPSVPETAVSHEILHQWFGGAVMADQEGGNWGEGLVAYLSDYRIRDADGEGWQFRKETLISYQSYVNEGNEVPLKSLSSGGGEASRAIGYGKSSMVFHMLRRHMGDEAFFRGVRFFYEKNKFKTASWTDIRDSFSFASGEELGWFFSQWTEEARTPGIGLESASVQYRGDRAVVTFDVSQQDPPMRISVPVLLRLRDGELRKTFELKETRATFTIEAEGVPRALVIDDGYDIFRTLGAGEFPPLISGLTGDRSRIFVVPDGEALEFAFVAEQFREIGCDKKGESEITYDDLSNSSLIIPVQTGLVKKLFGKVERSPRDFSLTVRRNPLNERKFIGLIDGSSYETIYAYVKKIVHFGNFSSIAFDDGRIVTAETEDSMRGIEKELSPAVAGVETSRMLDLARIIEQVSDSPVVYVGESHDRFEHHRVQLEVIRELFRKNGKVAIGMEMFQKPFQEALDSYIAGEIDEKTFIKESEYFRRWGFNYNLYREILLFAREHSIPVIALNLDRDIVSKVSKGGIFSLSEEERAALPEYVDHSNDEYRSRLKGFFESHGTSEKNFDFFYQAQLLWDETMALNLSNFIEQHPGHQVVVVAGVGHMAFGSGIPERAYRLNGRKYAIILNAGEIEEGIADYIVYPPPLDAPEPPMLMVVIDDTGGEVRITGFAPGSVSEKAGLRENDVILSLDDVPVTGIEDVKIFLLDRKKGDTVSVKVKRQRFLFGPEELTVSVVL